MLWLSAILVVFFGALTIYFHDQRFIQIKPTIIYAFFAVLLFGGLLRGRPLLKYLLEAAYDGLDQEGWLKLSRNWALFFVAMAIANEVMRATLSFDVWLTVKVWGVTIVSFLFAASNIPMLMKHGLVLEKGGAEEAAAKGDPPQG
jgi:intracellular septation protein